MSKCTVWGCNRCADYYIDTSIGIVFYCGIHAPMIARKIARKKEVNKTRIWKRDNVIFPKIEKKYSTLQGKLYK